MSDTASRYDYQFDPSGDGTAARVCRLVGSGHAVLELGCAAGAMSAVLNSHYGCRVTGIEFEGPAAESARRFCERVEQADLDGPDWASRFEQGGFDRILAADVLEHLRDPLACARQLRGLLAPGGRLVVSVPSIAHSGVLAALLLGDFSYRETGLMDRTHIHFFTASTLCHLLNQAGFDVDHMETVDTGPWHPEFSEYWDKLPAEVRDALARNPMGRAYQVIVRAQPASSDTALARPDALAALDAEQSSWLASWAQALRMNGELTGALEASRAELEGSRRELQESRHALAVLQASRSWKLTAPLRYLAGKLKSRP